ncbi:putative phosphothreonine lyase domain-containg protein [Nitrosomonas sp. Nm34]|uniref:putative phosphothreonine lyase domain-containing protein n=1 Tax=Nitrosomonas sp. Nm34 TaxID=1881055 RepID=UPI0008E04976|nr:putative phosphothreonine lyase domain-containg protein [Nitrosomonas sp. Nm34]SFI36696.1 protein of unknown function [Nitrosomonas sp. Nm34]
MRKTQLIDAIFVEWDRIWGSKGFDGTSSEYNWLQHNYGISEEDDVRWQLILEHDADELADEDREDHELMKFLEDEHAVQQFLQQLLRCYRSASIAYLHTTNSDQTLPLSQILQPSQVTDIYWIRAERQIGEYPPSTERGGKWLIFVPIENLDETWEKIRIATENGELGSSAKASTAKPNQNAANETQKVICVYSYDWTNKEDVMRIRNQLRHLGITWKIPYKSDDDTYSGKYANRGAKRISKYFE